MSCSSRAPFDSVFFHLSLEHGDYYIYSEKVNDSPTVISDLPEMLSLRSHSPYICFLTI